MQEYANSNKIKENKYKILRMSLLLGRGEDQEETLNNFEEAAREIDAMNDEIYLKDLEDKFYDTLKLEEEEQKLAVLVDYIGGRVEQRISLLSDFANVTGYDLTNLPPIKYYDKLDDYKERLKYIREYLENTKEIEELNTEIETAEEKLKEAFMNKKTAEDYNTRNEEILLNKFENILKTTDLKDTNIDNIDAKLNEIISAVADSKKSLDIFTKSFDTLSGSGISYEEEEEYKSYVENAKMAYYVNKEQEYLLRIYQYLLHSETEYHTILTKREAMNDLLYERINLRKELKITTPDILNNLYDLLEKQYEDIKHQSSNIETITTLTENIQTRKEKLNELELDNQKVEILALLREFCLIDTYTEDSPKDTTTIEPSVKKEAESLTENNDLFVKEESVLESKEESLAKESTSVESTPKIDIFNTNLNIFNEEKKEEPAPPETYKDNQVVSVENATNIDLDFIHSKANKVMQRVGEMLGIKPNDSKIVSVENDKQPELPKEEPSVVSTQPEPIANPLFTNEITPTPAEKEEDPDNSFWFSSDSPDALNELPDLEVSKDNFFQSNPLPDLNFPDLKLDFGPNTSGEDTK